jgi:hypothetical protein
VPQADVEFDVEIDAEIVLSDANLDEPPADEPPADDSPADEPCVADYAAEASAEATAEAPAQVNDDPFARLGDVLADAARTAGCDDGGIHCVRALLGFARVDSAAWPAAAVEALLAAGMLQRTERGLARGEGFARQVLGWQGILRGESEDFGACGAAMLDEWCAMLVAHVIGSPSRAEGLRRELRRCGVAAFGLVADAA